MDTELRKGLAIGDIPPTPPSPTAPYSGVDQAEELLMKFAWHYGIPTGYIQEQDGRIIQNIVPVKKTENDQISSSSKVDLAMHTETAFHPYKPSHVLLMCLRGEKTARTTYARVDHITCFLTKETTAILKEPLFITSIDDSFRTKGEVNKDITLPVLEDSDDGYNLTFDYSVMRGATPEAQQALDRFKDAIEPCITGVTLEAGDLLVLNNKKVIHGRTRFTPRYDGTDRWLQRVLVVEKMPPHTQRVFAGGMIITTDFSQELITGDHPYNWGRK